MWHVIVSTDVSRAIRGMGLPREAMLALLNRLYSLLESNPDPFRRQRDPAAPDTAFLYTYALFIGGRWRRFTFSVCDTIAEGQLHVESVSVI